MNITIQMTLDQTITIIMCGCVLLKKRLTWLIRYCQLVKADVGWFKSALFENSIPNFVELMFRKI